MDVPFEGSGHRIKKRQALVVPVSPSLPGNGLDVWRNLPQKKHFKLHSNPILDYIPSLTLPTRLIAHQQLEDRYTIMDHLGMLIMIFPLSSAFASGVLLPSQPPNSWDCELNANFQVRPPPQPVLMP